MAEIELASARQSRSPNYPYINLSVALERSDQLYASSKGNPVRLVDAADDWGLSATSSGTQRVAAALISFGLLSDEGAGEDRRLRLTPTALRILGDTRPGVRDELVREAALRPALIREYYMKWKHRRPSDTHAISQLKFDSGFNDDAARMFLRVFDDALSYVQDTPETSDVELSSGRESLKSPQPDSQFTPPMSESVPTTPRPAIRGDEWLKVKVGRDTTAQIYVEGLFGRQELERLVKMLQVQMEMMDEDF